MEDSYDNKNGYNDSDFKRHAQDDSFNQDQDGGAAANPKMNQKADEYMRELLSEKIKIDEAKFPYITKLLDQEITRVQTTGRLPARNHKYVDVFHDKVTRVAVKVLVPIKEHPKFNFVGKLLGPKGNTLKYLQDETMCKMAILGRGSMRDKKKEDQLRQSLDPKYAHLSDELHVEITAMGPPAEAHARIAYALTTVGKHLVPEPGDMAHQPPMHRGMLERPVPGPHPIMAPRGPPPPRPSLPGHAGGMTRAAAPPPKNKVMSILDRARTAIEDPYYTDSYNMPPEPVMGPGRPTEVDYYYERRPGGGGGGGADRYYEEDYYKEEQQREYKPREQHPQQQQRRGGHHAPAPRYRASPYARPAK